jgi:hypothetical protein
MEYIYNVEKNEVERTVAEYSRPIIKKEHKGLGGYATCYQYDELSKTVIIMNRPSKNLFLANMYLLLAGLATSTGNQFNRTNPSYGTTQSRTLSTTFGLTVNANTLNTPVFQEYLNLGTDTSTKSTQNMSSLVSPLGIAPNAVTTNMSDNPNVSSLVMNFTWNAGTITNGTAIGELGFIVGWGDGYGGNNSLILTRLSVADGTLSTLIINSAYPFGVSYTIME